MSLREEIDALNDQIPIEIVVPQWKDKKIWVRSLSAFDTVDIIEMMANNPDKYYLARAVARLLCDESGTLLYDFQNEDDLKALNRRNKQALEFIFNEGWKLNKNVNTDVEAAKKN